MAVTTKTAELVSDGSGDASVTLPTCNGVLRAVVSVPDTGAAQPTALWDATVSHQGTQVYQDTALINSANTLAMPSQVGTAAGDDFQFPLSGVVTVVGANMGSAKRALVTLYLEQQEDDRCLVQQPQKLKLQ